MSQRAPTVRERAGIDIALDHVAAGHGRILVIEGAPGLGKSALLAETARDAGSRQFAVASSRARREDDERGSAINTAVGQFVHGRFVARSEEELLDQVAELAPIALMFDNAHLADHFSLRLLVGLAQHIRSRSVLIAVALRHDLLDDAARASIADLLALEHTLRLTLGPMTRDESDRLVRAELPDASLAFCAECAELTGGNPFLLQELVTWISTNHLKPGAGTPTRALEPVPLRPIRQFVGAQFETLGHDAMAIAAAMAFAERGLTLAEATRIAGLDRIRGLRAVDALLESGLIAAGGPLAFAAAVVAHCLAADTPPLLAAEVRRRSAEFAGENEQGTSASAHHLLLAPPTGDPRVVERLVELADHEVAQGNPHDAQTLIRRALDEGAEDTHAKSRLLVRLGHVNLLQGRPTSTASLAAGVAGLEAGQDRADALLKLGVAQVAAGSPRDAAVAFDAARDGVPADDPLRRRAEATSAFAGLLVPETRSAALARLEQLQAAPSDVEQPWEAEALLAEAWRRLCQGQPHAGVVDMAQRALESHCGDGESLGGYFNTTAAAVLAFADDFAGAERVCDAAEKAARRTGSVLAERNLEVVRALTLLLRGRVRESSERCTTLLAPEEEGSRFNRAGAAAILARALHEREEPAEAGTIVRTALGSVPMQELQQLFLLEARSEICLDRGDLAAAFTAVHEAEYLAESFEITNPAVVAWQPTAAVCYARSGDRPRARELADEATEIAESFGTPRAIALTLRTKARVVGPPRDLGYLQLALAAIESSGALLERARVLVEYGAALDRAGRKRFARICLRQGMDLAESLGAERVSRRGLSALLAAGGRPRRVRTTGPASLTPAERRVVDLASSGASNPEIAESLVITRKTVEWHLNKSFAKLKVGSREDLAGVMAQQ